ncbi:hypothetical protein KLP40_14050 [Hymenobacter sp. NST-14]|nr:hypothetical protein [Hymenobacter piscis]
MAPSCSLDIPNPNAATEQSTLSSRDGVLAFSVGLRQTYATQVIEPLLLATGTTSREVKGITTFINVTELEQGGTQLSPNNANLTALFGRPYRIVSAADQLLGAAPATLATDAATLSGVLAHAYLFKAAALLAVAQGFEQAPVSAAENAAFVPRTQVLAEAVRLLDLAAQTLTANAPSAEFNTRVLGPEFDLPNTVQAYRARANLMAGNYAAALAAANLVDLTKTSVFVYTGAAPNPIFTQSVLAGNFKPRDQFGLPADLVEAQDARLSFYLQGPAVTRSDNGSTSTLRELAGFFTSQVSPIPAYLPDEMRLIRAEANLRAVTPDLAAALLDINAVRTQTAGDPLGVNAALPPYAGPETVAALLQEVYKQRSAELFLSGLHLDDSRRFGRPAPAPNQPISQTERSRNFYPYPQQERINNPNVPADPAI